MVPETIIGLPMALSLGLMYGAGPCLLSCTPYLAPVFLGRDIGLRRSWRIVLPLSLGRLAGYSGLGGIAGLAGQSLAQNSGAPVIHLVVGSAALMIGLSLLWRRPACQVPERRGAPTHRPLSYMPSTHMARPLLPTGLFLMGLGMALTPCAPLSAVIFSAGATASALAGAALGLAFGLGAIVVPALVFGIGAAHLGQELRDKLGHWRSRIEWLGAGLLVMTGLTQLIQLIKLI